MSSGHKGTYNNPFPYLEYLDLLRFGLWSHGFVQKGDDISLVAPGLENPWENPGTGTGTGTGTNPWPEENNTGVGTGESGEQPFPDSGGEPDNTSSGSGGGSTVNMDYTGIGNITGSIEYSGVTWNATGTLLCQIKRIPGVGMSIDSVTCTVQFVPTETTDTLENGTTINKTGNIFTLTGILKETEGPFINTPLDVSLTVTTSTSRIINGETTVTTEAETTQEQVSITYDIEVLSINTSNHTMELALSTIELAED